MHHQSTTPLYNCTECGKPSKWRRCRSCSGKEATQRRLQGLGPTRNACADCGGAILKRSTYCGHCSQRRRWEDPAMRQKMIDGLIRSHPLTANRACRHCGASVKPGSDLCNSCAGHARWARAGHREHISTVMREAYRTRDHLIAARKANPFFQRGSAHPRFTGSSQQRHTIAYSQWRNAVLLRDGHRCVECGSADSLHVHHVEPYAKFPNLRLVVSNGITLCIEHHRTKHDHFIPDAPAYKRQQIARMVKCATKS